MAAVGDSETDSFLMNGDEKVPTPYPGTIDFLIAPSDGALAHRRFVDWQFK
jgi:hypothetical protein